MVKLMLKANCEAKTYSFKGSTISKQQKRQLVSHKTLILIFHLKITLKIFVKTRPKATCTARIASYMILEK